ncbi:MAG: cadherin-like beta sandwich domain-containing protein [Eubacteriales bacterium]|nr:cadherin-like beta sandwich domain-containing protein [Eubacteriales bacterium]
MKKILSLLMAFLVIATLSPVLAQSGVAPERLTSLVHNAPNTGIMLPAQFDPNQTTYLLTVADWVSRIRFTPYAASPTSVVTVNGQVVASGQESQIIQMTNEPQATAITVTAYGAGGVLTGQTTYTVYLQRRPSERRTRVSAGYITEISIKDNVSVISADLITLNYQPFSNISSFFNDSNYIYRNYQAADSCLYYFGTLNNPVRAKNAQEFINSYQLGGSTLYYLVYIEDKIVAVLPYDAG